jgi:hypothetical protein
MLMPLSLSPKHSIVREIMQHEYRKNSLRHDAPVLNAYSLIERAKLGLRILLLPILAR